MSAWYRTGTIASAGNVVTGTGTKWADNKMGIGAGQILIVPGDGIVQMYEILRIDSDTQLRLVNAPSAELSGAYAIVSFYTDSVPDLSRKLTAQLAYYQSQMDGWQQILTGSGDTTLIAPDGTEVTIPALGDMVSTKEMNDAISNAIAPLMPRSGGTFSGAVVLSGDATEPLNPVTKKQFDILKSDAFTASQVSSTPWVPLTLLNGWTHGGDGGGKYRKVLGHVEISLTINDGYPGDNTVIANLPIGLRPLNAVYTAIGFASAWDRRNPLISVRPNGDIVVEYINPSTLILAYIPPFPVI